jgi:hypothetical protein
MADKDAGWGAGVSSGPAAFGHEFHETLVGRAQLVVVSSLWRLPCSQYWPSGMGFRKLPTPNRMTSRSGRPTTRRSNKH